MSSWIGLFIGAGGLALGVAEAGSENRRLLECNSDACRSLTQNEPHFSKVQSDVKNVEFLPYLGEV